MKRVSRMLLRFAVLSQLHPACATDTTELVTALPPPLDFSAEKEVRVQYNGTGNLTLIARESMGRVTCRNSRELRARPRIWRVREMLSPERAQSFLSHLNDDSLFNKDADSVDGKPTDEMILLRDGKLAPPTRTEIIPLLWHAQQVFEQVSAYVRQKLNCPKCEVCTSLVRKYGNGSVRQGVLMHFDEKALATAIISLDHSDDYEGGLVVKSPSLALRLATLEQGDLILHSYDLLHAVDIRKGTRRSLIMWISSDSASCRKQSTPWKRRAARRGDAHAQFQLGRAQIFGEVPGGKARGWRWIIRAAQQRHPSAQLNLGLREMERGKVQKARKLWISAAHQGNVEAAHNLGITFLGGDGVLEPNPKRGMKWLRDAASKGDADSAALLAGCLVYTPPCAG